jgi:hypothetical protein
MIDTSKLHTRTRALSRGKAIVARKRCVACDTRKTRAHAESKREEVTASPACRMHAAKPELHHAATSLAVQGMLYITIHLMLFNALGYPFALLRFS